MSKNINISVHGKIAVYGDIERIVCNNTDYVAVFDLTDSEFTSGSKYLVLVTEKGKYLPIPFTGTECALPAFTTADGASVKLGIYEGSLSTTTPAEVLLQTSILSLEAGDAEATDDGTYEDITADEITDEDKIPVFTSNGEKCYARIDELRVVFDNSYWLYDSQTETLTPMHIADEEDDAVTYTVPIDMDGGRLLNLGGLQYDDGKMGMKYRVLFAVPTAATTGEAGEIVYCRADNHFYVCYAATGGSYTWEKIPYSSEASSAAVMTGATASEAGAAGLVPAPAAGDNTKFLRGDGTWHTAGEALTFDATPTANSINPVYSGGVYSALTEKVDTAQGVANAGKIAMTDASGNVTWVTPTQTAVQTLTTYNWEVE